MDGEILSRISTVTKEEEALLSGNALQTELYFTSPAFVIDAKRLLKRGQLISLRPHTRFIAFPSHRHNYVELMYMVSGQTVHTINDSRRLTLKKGELLLLNQHASHGIDAAGMADVAVNIIVLPAFFDAVLSLIGNDNVLNRFITNALRAEDTDVSYLHFKVADVAAIQSTIESMIATLINEEQNHRRIDQVAMGLLFLHLLNHMDKASLFKQEPKPAAIVLAVLFEIENNYKDVSLSRIAERFKVSIAYLSRVVKEGTGLSYKALLKQKRLEKAADLLKNTRLRVEDIIDTVGYQNSGYFYRLFEEKYRLSPKTYREGLIRS